MQGELWRTCMNMMMGSGGMLMMLVMILFWIAVIALVVLGIRWLWKQQGSPGMKRNADDPVRILERRYAAGEIDRDEFEERRRQLSGASAPR